MSTDKQISMLDELQGLLQQQLELAHQGNSAGERIEVLGRQADCLVEKITQAGILERAEFESQKKKLKKSYEDLHLAITAQKAETNEKLIQVRRGRNIVETYRSNI
ncbi:MAG: hypothetical protein WBC05_24480 [Sedimentisphaerales bacterium]